MGFVTRPMVNGSALTHYKKGVPSEYVLSALLKLLQKGAPFYDQH